MKTRIHSLLVLLLLAGGCIEDKGNYNYTRVNPVEIGGFAKDTLFEIGQYDTLVINPGLQFPTGEITDLSYAWKINYETVSTDPVLRQAITHQANATLNTSFYYSSLTVTDNTTGLKYFKDFRVRVTTSVTTGLFILSEQPDETAKLSFQRRDRPGAPVIHDLFEDVNPTFGSLGKKPRRILYAGYLGVQFIIVCKEGERPVSLLDPATLKLRRALSKETVNGGYTGDFAPDYFNLYMGGMVASDGKIFGYNYMGNETLYRPIPPDGSREFAPWVETNTSIDAYAWMSYDNKNECFVQLEPESDPLLYSKITPLVVEGYLPTAEQKFLAGGRPSSPPEAIRAILYNPTERKAYFYNINMVDEFDFNTWTMTIITTVNLAFTRENLVDEQSTCFYLNEYWYLASGNTVKRIHENGGTPLTWFTAPAGNVTSIVNKTVAGVPRLIIATHDGTKSYIYMINLATGGDPIEEPLETEGKVAAMLAKGTWTY